MHFVCTAELAIDIRSHYHHIIRRALASIEAIIRMCMRNGTFAKIFTLYANPKCEMSLSFRFILFLFLLLSILSTNRKTTAKANAKHPALRPKEGTRFAENKMHFKMRSCYSTRLDAAF